MKPDKLVVSFTVSQFSEKRRREYCCLGMLSADLFELREIQFPGSTKGHRVP